MFGLLTTFNSLARLKFSPHIYVLLHFLLFFTYAVEFNIMEFWPSHISEHSQHNMRVYFLLPKCHLSCRFKFQELVHLTGLGERGCTMLARRRAVPKISSWRCFGARLWYSIYRPVSTWSPALKFQFNTTRWFIRSSSALGSPNIKRWMIFTCRRNRCRGNNVRLVWVAVRLNWIYLPSVLCASSDYWMSHEALLPCRLINILLSYTFTWNKLESGD
jgi:hypothetical protein